MKDSEHFERCAASRFLPRRAAHIGLVVLIVCGLATHVLAGDPVPFIYQNPYLLVTKGTATVIDSAGNRKTVEATTIYEANGVQKSTLPGVVTLSGGDTVETSDLKTSYLKTGDTKKSELCMFSPAAGNVMASVGTTFHLSPGKASPKTVVDKENAGAGTSLELLKGALFLTIDGEGLRKANKPEFTLRMPKNILAVKGTEFSVVHDKEQMGVMMKKGAVELRSLDGRTIAYLENKNMKDTFYWLNVNGDISHTVTRSGLGSGSNEKDREVQENLPKFPWFRSNVSFVEAEAPRREVTVAAIEQGSDRPRKKTDYVMLKTNDKERAVAISYRRPDKGAQPEELIVRIQMPYQKLRHFSAAYSNGISRYGLLLQLKSSAKLQARLDGKFVMRDKNYNTDVTGYVGLSEPGMNLELGETIGWQSVFVPLSSGFPAVKNEKSEDDPCLKITLKIPPELAEFQIEFSPIFVSEGARSSERD